jgi:DNA-binding CsgD family transcriptional regulator
VGSAPHALLERHPELSELRGELEKTKAGHGGFVLIEGPAGIGKTTLLGNLRRRAQRDRVTVLHARGGEIEQEFAYGVIHQLFEPQLTRVSPKRRAALLSGAAELASPLFGNADADAGDAIDPTYPILHGLYWLVANLAAEAPLILLVDDLHFADLATLRFLAFLQPRLEELPVLVSGAIRTGEATPGSEVLRQIETDSAARVIRPAPLSIAATSKLTRRALGSASSDLCRACQLVTGGNPFLLSELIVELASPTAVRTPEAVRSLGPETIAHAVLVRLARIRPPAAEFAKALAVVGKGIELRHVAALTRLSLSDAEAAADALAEADILASRRPLAFVHPIIEAAIRGDLSQGMRGQIHKRAARQLASEGAEANELAPHLVHAEPAGDPWVIGNLRGAARWALARGAPETAVTYLERALREPPELALRAPLLFELGKAETYLGRVSAMDHLREAFDLSSDDMRVDVALHLSRVLVEASRLPEVLEILDCAALDAVGQARLRIECELASWGLFEPSLRARAGDRLRRLESEITGHDLAEQAALSTLAFDGYFSGRSADEVIGLACAALAGGTLLDRIGLRREFTLAVVALLLADQFALAESACDQGLTKARTEGDLLGFSLTSCFRAMLGLRTGRLAEAEADARASLEVVSGASSWQPMSVATLVQVLIERGQLAAAREEFARAGDDHWRHGNLQMHLCFYARGLLSLAEGSIAQGLDEILDAGQRQIEWGMANPANMPWRSTAALACAALGNRDRAHDLAEEEVALARAFGAPRALGIALRANGLIEGGERGLELLEEAAGVLEATPAVLERARVLVDLGATRRRAGQVLEARAPLRLGLDLADRCGASILADRASHELRAAGLRPRRNAASGLRSLTPSEHRVAELVAAGMSNREAAQALFVTEKTVEAHLASAYRKLGIHSRHELDMALSPPERKEAGRALALAPTLSPR